MQIRHRGAPLTRRFITAAFICCLNFEVILVRCQFAVFQFGKPVAPVFIDVGFVLQIARVKFFHEDGVGSRRDSSPAACFHAHGFTLVANDLRYSYHFFW